jgi:hypothetical protein
MKRIILLVAVLLIGYWIIRQNPRDAADDASASTNVGKPSKPEPRTQWAEPSRTEQLRSIIESDNVPIQFYGMVLDETGAPLPDVKVFWRVLKAGSFAPSLGLPTRSDGTVSSDADGKFSVKETGSSISIESFVKAGYKEARQIQASYGYGSNAAPHQPDKLKPVRFLMVKDGAPPSQKINVPMRFDWDGNAKDFEIGTKTFSEKITLVPSLEPHKPGEPDLNWKLILKAKSGRLILGKQGDAPLAPESGYADEVLLQKDFGGQRGSAAEALLYLKTDSGKFAELRITAYSDRGMESSATGRLSIRWNPTGGRSFE